MTWFKVDDGFWAHPKTLMLSNDAIALWLKAGTWACQHLTDGVIPRNAVAMLGGINESAAELVSSGLWDDHTKGYAFHDWDEYQPSAAVEKAKRANRAESARKAACARWHGAECGGQCESHASTHTKPHAQEDAQDDASEMRDAMPRPVPSRSVLKNTKRGTRVPDSFEISEEMRAWARTEVPLVNVDAKLPEWLDFWRGIPGNKGVKLDWVSTWRNGMRKQQEFAERDAARTTPRKVKRFNDESD